jgi:DNA-binding PadR family transcriptional regulator
MTGRSMPALATPRSPPMNVRTICLAILFEADSTGYEIRKLSTEGEYAYFVEASFGSIYPALARLEKEGLVTSKVKVQKGKPAKKVYSITKNGREVFITSLFEPTGNDVYRSEFLLLARFAPELPADLVEERIFERMNCLNEEIASLEEISSERQKPADQWIINYGLQAMRFSYQYLSDHKNQLIALAKPARQSNIAAQ